MQKQFVIQNLDTSFVSFIQPFNSELKLYQHGGIKSAMKFETMLDAERFIDDWLQMQYPFLSVIPVYFL